jgi:hypothetical protein
MVHGLEGRAAGQTPPTGPFDKLRIKAGVNRGEGGV